MFSIKIALEGWRRLFFRDDKIFVSDTEAMEGNVYIAINMNGSYTVITEVGGQCHPIIFKKDTQGWLWAKGMHERMLEVQHHK